MPTYPSPKPTLTLSSHLGQNVGVGEGKEGIFPETYNDPPFQGVQIVEGGKKSESETAHLPLP